MVNILEEVYDPPEGEPASELTLNLRLEYLAPFVRGSDLTDLAGGILDTSLPDGYQPMPETLTITHLTDPQFQNPSTASWRIRAERAIKALPDPNDAVSLALGQPPAGAVRRLAEALPLSGLPELDLYPSWWPVMPFLPFRITVNGN
jgi:hypothetical protein